MKIIRKYTILENEPAAPIIVIKSFDREICYPGRIDSGAFITVIPQDIIKGWCLPPVAEVVCRDFEGVERPKLCYLIEVELNGLKIGLKKVISANRQDVLIGRDILNSLNVLLKGKEARLVIQDPAIRLPSPA